MYTGQKKSEYELKRYYKRRNESIEKLGGECVQCGGKDNLQFDHIKPELKQYNVSKFWSISIKELNKELEKCQLLCPSCHDEKTYGEIRKSRKHGTHAMYTRGKCRCQTCRDFFNAYRREWLQRKKRAAIPTVRSGRRHARSSEATQRAIDAGREAMRESGRRVPRATARD